MSSWQGPPVLVGERALWLGCGSGLPRPGVIKWIGHLPGIGPDWTVGLELDEALPVGGIDGSWGGRVLFTCKPKHGLLVPIASIIPGSQLKHLPTAQNFEKSQNATDLNNSGSILPRQNLSLPQSVGSHEVTQEKEFRRPLVRQKRRIPTPPTSDCDEPDLAEDTEAATLRVEEIGQEDSLKKRLRLLTDHNEAAQRKNGLYNNYALQEVVIDSLYAQRHHQFVKHGRSQSETTQAFVSSASSSNSRRERNSTSAIFSIFRWFRKESRSDDIDAEFAPSAPPSPQLVRGLSSSCGSVDTLFSTASSFAFVHPALYRPFGAANAPEKRILPGPETETYRNRLRQRDKIRELDKNLTLKKKYHLFGSGTLYRSAEDVNSKNLFLNKSLDSLKIQEISSENKNSTLGRKKRKAPPPPVQEDILSSQLESNKENTDVNATVTDSAASPSRPRHRRTVSDSAKDRKSGAFVHVKGKRKAPPPPDKIQSSNNKRTESHEILGTQSLGRKKRPAPLPPLEIENTYRIEDRLRSQNYLSPEEKQKLIENIAKLQAHADRRSLLLLTPPDSPTLNNKMSHIVCNDSLKLERGVLKANKMEVQSSETKTMSPTPVSPRPWYKRNNKEKSLEKKKDKSKTEDWMPEVAIARGNVMNQDLTSWVSASSGNNSSSYRLSNIFSRFEKPEEKRKSQISMLANISELDREAAEIVQKEQEKEKAILAAHNAKYYTTDEQSVDNFNKSAEVEVHAEESRLVIEEENIPRKSGARELISLFNALGNVTKVTVNSAFFSREGPSIFTKEGIEKRFSRSNESMKASEEIFTENASNLNGNKQETVVVETKETYLESPGNKRRRNFVHNNSKSDDSTASGSDMESSKVVIEEIKEFEKEKSKIQALYEANKIRKHHSPSPSIPAIAEMSESISSVTTSPSSTLNPSDRSASITPTPITSPTLMPVVSSQPLTSSKNFSVWSCPRCTLENPRWRVTCEACDMWRPAVRRDVVDKLTNANMGTTIAVNGVKAGQSLNCSEVKTVSSDKNKDKIIDSKPKVQILEKKTTSKDSNSSGAFKIERSKPMTVSGLLCSGSYKPEEPRNVEPNTEKQPKSTAALAFGNSGNVKVSSAVPDSIASSSFNIPSEIKAKDELSSGNVQTEETSKLELTTIKSETEMEEVRKARLAFFEKSQCDIKRESDEIKKENHKAKSHISQAKIDALFSIASKGSLATNEEERLKVKEILKEMKDSLPKRTKKTTSDKESNKTNTKTDSVAKEDSQSTSADAARLGAIRKSTALNSSPTSNSVKMLPVGKRSDDKKTEIFLVKSETIIEEIKVKTKDGCKTPKVSTSVQTNGVIRKVEPTLPAVNKEELKPVTAKPPTPKAVRKDVVVPVTVEEHIVKDGKVHTTVSKEPRKMSIGTFELIRPRDFATIEATKTGNEIKSPTIHVYANVPSTHNEDTSTVSTSNDSPEINQWTARFSKPRGLADFKAAVLESTAGDKMSTLAVNRLLKQLESAIAGGQHQRAAALAQELAKHKVSCSVTRHQRTNDIIVVDMYVEDKLSHQGPFPLQVSPALTVVQLKAKVEREFEIPAAVQRWILGKELAVDDTATLQHMGVSTPHCPVFLYLVAPDGAQDKTVNTDVPEIPNTNSSTTEVVETGAMDEAAGVTEPNRRGWYFNEEDDRYSICESENTDHSSKNASPEPIVDAAPEATQEAVVEDVEVEEGDNEEVEIEELDDEAEVEEVEEGAVENEAAAALGPRNEMASANRSGTLTIGWKCAVCTLVNAPTRPGCLACAADRPADYSVPLDYEAGPAERVRLDNDLQAKQAEADEKRKNYERMMMLEKADLIPTTEPFECSVCLSTCEAADGVMLRDCLHIFCRGCLAHTVQYTEDAEVKCPFRDHNYACDSTLQEREIKALVSAEVYEQHLAKSVALAENKIGNAFHCKTPDCPGWCIFEDNVNTFQCPVCDQTNCLTCQAIHQGLDCKQYQEKAQQEVESNADARRTREMLEEMIQRGEALACPTCQVVLLKKWGCDWLRCSMCKTEICWVTKGPRWGPNGKGDTSGGCQCGVNGVKCHPKCNYCH